MSSRYPHSCRIYVPGVPTGEIDTESGQPTGEVGSDTVVYSGECYYDEAGNAVARARGGDTDIEGHGVLRVPRRAGVFDPDTCVVSVTYAGVQMTGRITSVRYMNQTIHLMMTPDTRHEAE